MRATIDWFEAKGKERLTAEVHTDVWYADFIEFLARERAFATLLTPARDGGGDPDKRWDTARNAVFNEILGFYGLQYWYAWQVTILGLGPIWQSDNDAARRRAARAARGRRGLRVRPLRARPRRRHLLDRHGPHARRRRMASARAAASTTSATATWPGMVSVFGRRADVEGPEGYVFFAADSSHPAYKLISNVVHGQMYVSAFDLEDYPVRAEDVLHTGVEAFEAALNTINVGKFNLGFCAIGMAEHCFYETVTQAENRVLFGKRVTEFGQVRRILTEAYARLRRGEALRRPRRRLRAQREPRGPPLSALHADQQDAGHHRGRADRAPAGRGDLGQGLRARQLLRERQEHHRRAAEARGHRPRQPRADAEVPAQLPVRERGARGAAGSAATPTTTRSSSPRARPAASARSPSRTGARSSTRFAASFPTSRAFASRPNALVSADRGGQPDHRADDRGPRLSAVARPALHPAPVRAADPRAGGA